MYVCLPYVCVQTDGRGRSTIIGNVISGRLNSAVGPGAVVWWNFDFPFVHVEWLPSDTGCTTDWSGTEADRDVP